ncbi:MAG: glycine betaine/L-proline ABC transporter ATP-binding protein [Desulfocurvibacter africanus]
MAEQAIIRIQNLYKIFGTHPEKAMTMLRDGRSKDEIFRSTKQGVGVADVSFEARRGEIVVVMGLSGSGKSTLVRCINRLIEPTAGSIFIDGQDITTMTAEELRKLRQRKMSMVFQSFALFPHRTVLDNASFGLEIQGVAEEERRRRAHEALELVGLAGWEGSYPAQLSGGMQQRVGLARALAVSPDILLMDEAFSALDPLIRKDMQDELLSLQETMRKTIVFISHDLDEALKLGDRIVLMRDGRIEQCGTGEEILANPATEYVRRFVEDVDVTKAVTAGQVMKRTEAVAYGSDGPRTALRRMQKAGLSSLFVVSRDGLLKGWVTADMTDTALKNGNGRIDEIMQAEVSTVRVETPAADIIPLMAAGQSPLPVVDDRGRLVGVVVRGSLIAGLAERGGNAQ